MNSFEYNFNRFINRNSPQNTNPIVIIPEQCYEFNDYEKPKSKIKYVQKELKFGNLTYKKTKYKHET